MQGVSCLNVFSHELVLVGTYSYSHSLFFRSTLGVHKLREVINITYRCVVLRVGFARFTSLIVVFISPACSNPVHCLNPFVESLLVIKSSGQQIRIVGLVQLLRFDCGSVFSSAPFQASFNSSCSFVCAACSLACRMFVLVCRMLVRCCRMCSRLLRPPLVRISMP